MMNELYDLCDNLKDEIKELNKKGDISPTELDRAYKAIDIIKDIKTIEAMEDASYSYDYSRDEYSRRGSYDGSYNSYDGMSNARRGRDGDGDGRYSEDGSYRRGRDAMGRYTSRDGYSRHDEKEQMMRQIEQMKRKVEQM
jgi:hypothetical protein